MELQNNTYYSQFVENVLSWDAIFPSNRRNGGTQFRIGPYKIGYAHRWGFVSIVFPAKIHKHLIAEDLANSNPIYPESRWIIWYLQSTEDVDHATWLLRLSYLVHIAIFRQFPTDPDLVNDTNIREELEAMDLNPQLAAHVRKVIDSAGHTVL